MTRLIAVSGATGYVGAATVSSLSTTRGLRVRVLTRGHMPVSGPDESVVGSILGSDACDRLAFGADVVLHAAGLVRSRDTAALHEVNVEGTARLLAAAARAGVERFVHVSSTGVYGHPGGSVNETSARRPNNPYERSKAEAEQLVLASGLNVVVVQPSNVIGQIHPLRPLRRFLSRIRAGRPVVHAGAWTNYVGVEDVARALVAAATAPDPPRVVIVNAPLPMRRFIELAAEAVNGIPRTVGLPSTIGRFMRPPLGTLAGSIPAVGRLEALVDGTRFETIHGSWFRKHDLVTDLRASLGRLAVEYGLK